MKRTTIGTALAAGTLALALLGCGGSSTAKEETPTYPEETTTEEQVQNTEGEQNAPEEQVEVTE